MLIIGLTGGIGSGKSIVAQFFAKLGVGFIDSDVIAREIVRPNTPALKKITDHFGLPILNEQHQLNREKLRKIIFQNPQEKNWLENLLHPLIIAEIKKQLTKISSPYCIVIIPLLFETNGYDFIDRILVIDAPEELQIKRTQKRDKCKEADIKAIMNAQVSRQHRLAKADDIITNDGNLETLEDKVKDLHIFYLSKVNEYG